jgi:hypothetical protein
MSETDYTSPEYMEKYNTARDELESAIKQFINVIDDGEQYLLHWNLCTHSTSIALEQAGMSGVGSHCDAEMTFVERRGILEVSLDRLRGDGHA